ncbi:universal stress protein [Actinoplanes sp. KI2]|uniref:universal stress protein n=1 Tax=Actinoplanes sp. KI2 TaxID=2983315 RepID=UPI0021D57DC8|nr:universal stress protein [Actinoplanes sp. KI2]MCU7722430.1 universal stress protein [Actinoplanes sp. KI2]
MLKARIVVGADGSPGSTLAVRWAAAEAQLREAELRVFTAYHRRDPGRQHDDDASAVVHEAVTQARTVAPQIQVRGLAMPGYAAPMLLHAAEDAALLVVGDRRRGSLPGQPLGSVGSQVATHARASVVVVRGRPGPDDGPVVVGVDDGPAASTIIGRAFEEAALRGAPLLAVTAHANGHPTPAAAEALGAEIDPRLDPWREKYPSVQVEREYASGRPDRVLVQRCQQAQLVVVGPRRHGYQGVMLGAVGSGLLRRAACPVLIAR